MGSNTKNCLSCGMPNWKEAQKCAECGSVFTEKPPLKYAIEKAIAGIIFHDAVIAPLTDNNKQQEPPPISKELLVKKGVIKEA